MFPIILLFSSPIILVSEPGSYFSLPKSQDHDFSTKDSISRKSSKFARGTAHRRCLSLPSFSRQVYHHRLLPPTSYNSTVAIQHNYHHHLDADLMNERRLHDHHHGLIESQGDLRSTGLSFPQPRGNDVDI